MYFHAIFHNNVIQMSSTLPPRCSVVIQHSLPHRYAKGIREREQELSCDCDRSIGTLQILLFGAEV